MSDTPRQRRSPVMFRDLALERRLQARARGNEGPGQVAKRDLGRYYDLLADALLGVAAELNLHEKMALLRVGERRQWDFDSADRVWVDVLDADAALFAQWDVDQGRLVETLRAFTVTERLALVDALERLWRLPLADQADGRTTMLEAVGLK